MPLPKLSKANSKNFTRPTVCSIRASSKRTPRSRSRNIKAWWQNYWLTKLSSGALSVSRWARGLPASLLALPAALFRRPQSFVLICLIGFILTNGANKSNRTKDFPGGCQIDDCGSREYKRRRQHDDGL